LPFKAYYQDFRPDFSHGRNLFGFNSGKFFDSWPFARLLYYFYIQAVKVYRKAAFAL